MKTKSANILFGFIAGFTLIFYIWMASQIPYTHDDWDWGLDLGLQQLFTANLNSRYVGNFIVVVLTRSVLLKNLIMGTVLFCIPLMAVKYYQIKNTFNKILCFIACNILLLTIEPDIWRQTAGWVSGFSNFMVSAFFIIIYFNIIEELFSDKSSNIKGWLYIPLFIFSVMIQLFIENVTCFILISGILALVFAITKHRNIVKYIIMLIGNIIGTIIMFSSNVYNSLVSEGQALNGYRGFTFDKNANIFENILSVSKVIVQSVIPNIWEKNWIVCIAITLIMIFMVANAKNDTNRIRKCVFIIINTLLLVYFVIVHIIFHTHYQYDQPLPAWHSIINIGFFVLVPVELRIYLFNIRKNMPKAIILWLSAPAIVAPLSLTTQNVAPRLYLTSTIFLILFAIFILKIELEDCDIKIKKIILVINIFIFVVILIYYGIIYYNIGKVKNERLNIIEKSIETESVEIHLPTFPYHQYL